MREAGLDREVLSILNLHGRVDASARGPRARRDWSDFTEPIGPPKKRRSPSASPASTPRCATRTPRSIKAAEHCGDAPRHGRRRDRLDRDDRHHRRERRPNRLEGLDAVIVPGGFGSARRRGQDRLRPLLPRVRPALPRHLPRVPGRRHRVRTQRPRARRCQLHRVPARLHRPRHRRAPRAKRNRTTRRHHAPRRAGRRPDARLARPRLSTAAISKVRRRERFRHRYEVDPSLHRPPRRRRG